MPRRPSIPCAGTCGGLIWAGSTSLPIGEAKCRPCRRAEWPSTCPECGAPFPPNGTRRFCSMSCAGKANARKVNAARPPRQPDPYRNARRCAERRARLRGARVEHVDPVVVFERDNYTCGICRGPVRRDVNGLHPEGATVDHIVPLALYGTHAYDNVQTAHRACNTRKGARLVDVA